MRPTMKDLKRQLSQLRGGLATPEDEAFERKCRDWLGQDSNRDGRGTKADIIKQTYWTCLWFKQSQTARDHEDSSIRHEARKVAGATLHEGFPEIRKRLSKLHGRVSVAGKKLAERRRHEAERVVRLDRRFSLREIRSMRSLQSVGRALRNCTAQKSFARQYLKHEDTEIWVLLKRGQPHCLLEIQANTSPRKITEFEGKGRSTPRLKRSLAVKILDSLEVDGDDEEVFANVGAFQAFRDGRPVVQPVSTEGCRHWVWVLRNGSEIVIATKLRRRGRKRWSRFCRADSVLEGGHWNHLSEGALLSLVLKYPSLAEALRPTAVPPWGEIAIETGCHRRN